MRFVSLRVVCTITCVGLLRLRYYYYYAYYCKLNVYRTLRVYETTCKRGGRISLKIPRRR